MSFAAIAGKTGQKGAHSLTAMAQHTLSKKVHEIVSFGDAPVHIILPVLRKVTDAKQLRALELESPQILEVTPELWRSLLCREFSDWESKVAPPEGPSGWWRVYRRLRRDDDAARQQAEEQLRGALDAAASHRKDHATLVLHAVLPEERQAIGYLERGVRSRDAGRNALNDLKRASSTARMTAMTYAKATPTNLRAQPPSSSPLSRPLSKIQGAVRSAPRSMISQYAARGAPTPGPPSQRFVAPTPPATLSGGASRANKAARNPFRAGAGKSNTKGIHAQALDLAVKLEAESDVARKLASERKLAGIRAAQDVAGRGTSSPPKAGPTAATAAATTTATAGVKRKAPNIFMAPKKPKRAP